MTKNKEYYKILIVGSSGVGKSYAARNLNPKTVGYVNAEDKPLPFKNIFENHERVSSHKRIKETLIKFAKDPTIETIIFDSFSAYLDMILKEARATKKGYDIWSFYNEGIADILSLIKRIPKDVLVLAHYEILNVEGDPEKRVKVKAKEWEGLTLQSL